MPYILSWNLLALALNQNDEMTTWLKTNGQVKEAVQLISNNQPSYPNQITSSNWAILNSHALIGTEQIKNNMNKETNL